MQESDYSIVLVEPEPVARLMLKAMLEERNYQVSELSELAELERSTTAPELVVFSSSQAGGDVPERIGALRVRWPEAAFWVLSSDANIDPNSWSADILLAKPIDPIFLNQQLEHFEHRNAQGMAPELNLDLLQQYREIVGDSLVRENLALFEQVLPEYLAQLEEAISSYALDELAEHAHKLKGAAASVGLLGIQEVAEKLQHREREDWDENYAQWVKWIQAGADENIAALKRWLQQ